MANPKRKISRAARGHRRSHLNLTRTQLVRCSHCSVMIRPHTVCAECGYYRGRQVLAAAKSN